MNSEPIETETVEQIPDTEPTVAGYEDSLEGMLQYHADLSMYYAYEAKHAKTNVKRDYFKRKQRNNNQKLYKLLVRTPNQFNPLMKYITPPPAPEAATEDANEQTITVPFCQAVDHATDAPEVVMTTNDEHGNIVVVK